VRSHWEDPVKAHGERRPPRRYYRITPHGERALAEALARFHALKPLAGRAARAKA
jgi:DNA-binding PadR family transcriptional regulator